ncbi:MAG: RNA polymerase sigma factor, partial [Candidatus Saccharibacteria bacterium]|nr:RNA polymerase sigma factor [Microbacteriaceae bacterium]
MATRSKTTAVAEPDAATEVTVDLADAVDLKTAPAKTAAAKTAAAKTAVAAKAAPAKKAPVKKPVVKRASKAATSGDEQGGPEDEAEVVVTSRKNGVAKDADGKNADAKDADAKDADAKDESAEDSDEDKDEKTAEILPSGALVLSLVDDEDEVPVYSSAITGATADPVKDYLKQIGKVALLNAAEEVELAMRIEAGLFAEDKLADMTPAELKSQLGR